MAQTNPLVALHPVGRAVHNGARSATTVVGRTKLTTLATIDVQWHFFNFRDRDKVPGYAFIYGNTKISH